MGDAKQRKELVQREHCSAFNAVLTRILNTQVDKTVAKYGKIDVLVSNAAVNPVMGAMLDTDEKAWGMPGLLVMRWPHSFPSHRVADKIFDINVKSHFFLIRDAVPHMPAGSAVIIIASCTILPSWLCRCCVCCLRLSGGLVLADAAYNGSQYLGTKPVATRIARLRGH